MGDIPSTPPLHYSINLRASVEFGVSVFSVKKVDIQKNPEALLGTASGYDSIMDD